MWLRFFLIALLFFFLFSFSITPYPFRCNLPPCISDFPTVNRLGTMVPPHLKGLAYQAIKVPRKRLRVCEQDVADDGVGAAAATSDGCLGRSSQASACRSYEAVLRHLIGGGNRQDSVETLERNMTTPIAQRWYLEWRHDPAPEWCDLMPQTAAAQEWNARWAAVCSVFDCRPPLPIRPSAIVRHLVALDLEGCHMGHTGVKALCDACSAESPLSLVTCWFLGTNDLNDESLEALLGLWCDVLQCAPHMRMLGLSNNPVGGGSSAAVLCSTIERCPKLERLHLNHAGITSVAWSAIRGSISQHKALRDVWAKQNEFGGAGETFAPEHSRNADIAAAIDTTAPKKCKKSTPQRVEQLSPLCAVHL